MIWSTLVWVGALLAAGIAGLQAWRSTRPEQFDALRQQPGDLVRRRYVRGEIDDGELRRRQNEALLQSR